MSHANEERLVERGGVRRTRKDTARADWPAAVILGIDTPIGLAIIRDLGRRGVSVHGIARSPQALGLHSRYLTQGHLRAADAALIVQLQTLRSQLGTACLYAIAESDIQLLNAHRAELAGYTLMFADARRMAAVLDKSRTLDVARQLGMHVPRTVQLTSLDDAAASCAGLRFPVVLKWSDANNAVRRLHAAGLAMDKARYCVSAADMFAYLRTFERIGIYPLIQEYCAGQGLGQFVLMSSGQARYVFQHRRLHEWPPEGGFSSLCVSLPPTLHAGLMAQSIALLRALDWDGVAMVEYRYDEATSTAALMEVNGRYWGSLPLACHAGAAFPWLAYRHYVLGRDIHQSPYRDGVHCRFMVPETKRLLRILFQPGRIADPALRFRRLPELANFLRDFVRPSSRYQVFSWTDPLPFMRDISYMLHRSIGQLVTLRAKKNSAG